MEYGPPEIVERTMGFIVLAVLSWVAGAVAESEAALALGHVFAIMGACFFAVFTLGWIIEEKVG